MPRAAPPAAAAFTIATLAARCTALLLLATSACATLPVAGNIPTIPVSGARIAPNPLIGQLLLPSGPGPHPAVILLHGCGGTGANTTLWADRLRGWGYAALTLDSLRPRSLSSVCDPAGQRLLTPNDRAGDVVAAATWLALQPGIDPARIAILGNSHGGATASSVANHPYADAAHGLVKAAVNYYGNCRNPAQYAGIPLLALAGTDDTWGPPARTCEAFAAALPPGAPFQHVAYPGAVHAFDNPNLVSRRFNNNHPLQYDPAAAEDSFTRVHAFLDRTIGPGG